jgi:RimJ/RimL family protein N-acetyltransferase
VVLGVASRHSAGAAGPGESRRCLGNTKDAMSQIEIRKIDTQDAESFRECLDSVARERTYLAQVGAPPLERTRQFVEESVAKDAAQYVAVIDGRVVGWCDIFAHWAYALQHVGTLGMGVHASFRGQGLGRRLIAKTLAHACDKGIYRVTLEAREDNLRAIRLYESMGFKHEGRAPCALRFDGVFYAGVSMALLQGPASDA